MQTNKNGKFSEYNNRIFELTKLHTAKVKPYSKNIVNISMVSLKSGRVLKKEQCRSYDSIQTGVPDEQDVSS
jgi:hypothetical protein